MPRKSRIDAAGKIHHVITRRINRVDIFSDDADYKSFLNRLGAVLTGTTASVICFRTGTSRFCVRKISI